MSHMSPAAIFSPSIARQQQAAAKDWNYIDSWLSLKFHNKTPPPFERNPETLKVLLSLATLNESSDEERSLLSLIETKTLLELNTKEEQDHHTELLGNIEENLTREGRTALQTLAELSVQLNISVPKVQGLGGKMLDLQTEMCDLEQAGERIEILERHLNTELSTINDLINSLQAPSYQAPQDIQKQTVDYQRRSKALSAKIPELRDRVASLNSSGGKGSKGKITIEDVKGEEEKFRSLMKQVRDLEVQVKGYHGLPQDTDLARLELEGLRVELQELSRKRDAMFEGLVERESPKKTRS